MGVGWEGGYWTFNVFVMLSNLELLLKAMAESARVAVTMKDGVASNTKVNVHESQSLPNIKNEAAMRMGEDSNCEKHEFIRKDKKKDLEENGKKQGRAEMC